MDDVHLSYTKDQQWLLMLKYNKAKEADEFLRSKDKEERQPFLHGYFVASETSENFHLGQDLMYSEAGHPCCIAAIHGSIEVLELLFRWV